MMTDANRNRSVDWIVPERLFDGWNLTEGMAVRVLDGNVDAVCPLSEIPIDAMLRRVSGLLAPGFFDTQVNGGGNVLFNHSPTRDGLERIATVHRQFGTVAILPTVITDAPQVLRDAVDAVLSSTGKFGLAGIHIEGPHISKARKGVHSAEHIRPMQAATMDLVRMLRSKMIPVLITVAPESTTNAQISELANTGAIVSIGHSDADTDQVRAALRAGATSFTHLFNGMPPLRARNLGVAGTAINSKAWCGIICDGQHVADELVGLAVRARPVADRMYLVSDAMPTVGGRNSYWLYGEEIKLEAGRLINLDGVLAGAHSTLACGLKRTVNEVGVPLETALRMAISNPAMMMGISKLASLVNRKLSDLIVLDSRCRMTGYLSDILISEGT